MSVNQCAWFFNNPRLVLENYLASTSTYIDLLYSNICLYSCGVVYSTDKEKGVKCYVDEDFAGGWDQADPNDEENSRSLSGYVITYGVCPVLWCSKLHTEISLSTTEVEYIALIQVRSKVIPFMELMK